MELKKINKKSINTIINKISILVTLYADKHSLKEYVINTLCVVDLPCSDNNHECNSSCETFYISKINFKSLMKQSEDVEVVNFIKTLQGLVSDTELETLFIKKFYPDYLVVVNSVQKIMYNLPKQISEDDFTELNKLYKKYTVTNDTSS